VSKSSRGGELKGGSGQIGRVSGPRDSARVEIVLAEGLQGRARAKPAAKRPSGEASLFFEALLCYISP